jgi:hypothetical protein
MRVVRWVLALSIGLTLVRQVSAVTLYDGSLGTAPESQGYLAYYSLPGAGTKSTAGGKTTYDSGALDSERGGFSTHTFIGTQVNPASPVLNRNTGYTVSIDARLLTETHANANRAGLSLIVLGHDLQGIELGFWSNEIWAQSGPTFTHAEGVAFNPTAASTTYDLNISGSTYTLLANNSQILTGSLRDYSSFGFPYTTTNWIFLGDDTSSARGSFEVSRIAVVPEPCTLLLPLLGALAVTRAFSPCRRLTNQRNSHSRAQRTQSPCHDSTTLIARRRSRH